MSAAETKPDRIVIKDIPGYEGEYPMPDELTNREMAELERISGVPASKMEEGYASTVIALAIILLRRTGKPVVPDMLWDAPGGSIQFVDGKQNGADASPPDQEKPSAPRSSGGDETRKE